MGLGGWEDRQQGMREGKRVEIIHVWLGKGVARRGHLPQVPASGRRSSPGVSEI